MESGWCFTVMCTDCKFECLVGVTSVTKTGQLHFLANCPKCGKQLRREESMVKLVCGALLSDLHSAKLWGGLVWRTRS